MDLDYSILSKIIWSIFVSIGFASLFGTPKRALWVVGLLGAVGFGIKTILLETILPGQLIFSSLFGATAVGLGGMYFAHRVHTPPIVFTIPAVINMIPGTLGYLFMMGLIQIISFGENADIDSRYVLDVMSNGLKCFFVTLALAIGVAFPVLIFNTYTVKNKDLHKLIKTKILKRNLNT